MLRESTSAGEKMSRSLEGIRVIDLSHVLAAPTATMIMADLGAEVIHIEPFRGDDARTYGPFAGEPDKNRSAYFISLNRNKKGMVLDLRQEKGKNILRALIGKGDVLVENFRPGTMNKMGFGWEDIQKINPRIVYASICGFGHDSLPEYHSRPFYDVAAQGYSGVMSITGPEGGPPCRVGFSAGDIIAGHQAVIAILAALRYRDKTGRGQHYDGSMVDGLFAVLENAVVRYTVGGEIPEPLGSRHPSIVPFQSFRTKDSRIITAIGNDELWITFCDALDRPELAADPRFRTNPLRTKNVKELIAILSEEFEKRTTSEWSDTFDKAGIPYSRVNNMKEICKDPHIHYRKMIVEIDQPGIGRMKIAGSPFRLSETPGEVFSPAPLLGEHTEEVLRDILGYSPEEIGMLRKERVINGHGPKRS
jgi:CoA:oxalate CoA-transferase